VQRVSKLVIDPTSMYDGSATGVFTRANEHLGDPLGVVRPATKKKYRDLVARCHKAREEILAAYPYLESEDISAALAYAAWRVQETEQPLP